MMAMETARRYTNVHDLWNRWCRMGRNKTQRDTLTHTSTSWTIIRSWKQYNRQTIYFYCATCCIYSILCVIKLKFRLLSHCTCRYIYMLNMKIKVRWLCFFHGAFICVKMRCYVTRCRIWQMLLKEWSSDDSLCKPHRR